MSECPDNNIDFNDNNDESNNNESNNNDESNNNEIKKKTLNISLDDKYKLIDLLYSYREPLICVIVPLFLLLFVVLFRIFFETHYLMSLSKPLQFVSSPLTLLHLDSSDIQYLYLVLNI